MNKPLRKFVEDFFTEFFVTKTHNTGSLKDSYIDFGEALIKKYNNKPLLSDEDRLKIGTIGKPKYKSDSTITYKDSPH